MPVTPPNPFTLLGGHLTRLDSTAPRAAARALRSFSGPVKLLNHLGDGGAVWVVLGGVEALRNPSRRRETLVVGVTLAAVAVLVNLPMKRMVNRPRPVLEADTPFRVGSRSGSSFPSGHAATSFAMAAVMPRAWTFGRFRWPLASLLAAGRVMAGAHHPSDVVVGSAVGTVLGVYARRFVTLRAAR